MSLEMLVLRLEILVNKGDISCFVSGAGPPHQLATVCCSEVRVLSLRDLGNRPQWLVSPLFPVGHPVPQSLLPQSQGASGRGSVLTPVGPQKQSGMSPTEAGDSCLKNPLPRGSEHGAMAICWAGGCSEWLPFRTMKQALGSVTVALFF